MQLQTEQMKFSQSSFMLFYAQTTLLRQTVVSQHWAHFKMILSAFGEDPDHSSKTVIGG